MESFFKLSIDFMRQKFQENDNDNDYQKKKNVKFVVETEYRRYLGQNPKIVFGQCVINNLKIE